MRRRRFILGIGAFALALRGRSPAQYAAEMTSDLGNQGALYRFQFTTGLGNQVRCIAAVLPRSSYRASLAEVRDEANAVNAVRDIARRNNATVAVNGGRFNGAFAPDGLLIVDGKTVGRKRADWDAFFTIDSDGRAEVGANPNLRAARYAVQGNATLVRAGNMGIPRNDHLVFRRTVAAQSGDVIIVMVTSPVALYELAYMLMDHPDAFYQHQIDNAVNLSGAATTGLYARLADGTEIDDQPWWANRDLLLFSTR